MLPSSPTLLESPSSDKENDPRPSSGLDEKLHNPSGCPTRRTSLPKRNVVRGEGQARAAEHCADCRPQPTEDSDAGSMVANPTFEPQEETSGYRAPTHIPRLPLQGYLSGSAFAQTEGGRRSLDRAFGEAPANETPRVLRLPLERLTDTPRSMPKPIDPGTARSYRSMDSDLLQLVNSPFLSEGSGRALEFASNLMDDSTFSADCAWLIQTDAADFEDAGQLSSALELMQSCLSRALEHRALLHTMLVEAHETSERRFLVLAAELRKAVDGRDAARGFLALSEDRRQALQRELQEKQAELVGLRASVAQGQEKSLEGVQHGLEAKSGRKLRPSEIPTGMCRSGSVESHFNAAAWLDLLASV